jgi:hypothetical protein
LCTVISPADAGRLFVNVTWVVCPVGRRMVRPGNDPPYVHRFVHGPGSIGRQACWMLIPRFDAVATGGNERGFEKGAGVAVAVGVGVAGGTVGVAVEVPVGVGLASPGVEVGVRVGVAVEVRVAVAVGVRVAVAVDGTAVNVGVEVRVAV